MLYFLKINYFLPWMFVPHCQMGWTLGMSYSSTAGAQQWASSEPLYAPGRSCTMPPGCMSFADVFHAFRHFTLLLLSIWPKKIVYW